jgi:hypothetical protein
MFQKISQIGDTSDHPGRFLQKTALKNRKNMEILVLRCEISSFDVLNLYLYLTGEELWLGFPDPWWKI